MSSPVHYTARGKLHRMSNRSVQLAQEGGVGTHVGSLAVKSRAASQAIHHSGGDTWRSGSKAGNSTLVGCGRRILATDMDDVKGGGRVS